MSLVKLWQYSLGSYSDEKNFEIEGFKLGDSLLNTYTEEVTPSR